MKISLADAPKMRRGHRRPQNPFNLMARPYSITPFMLHPVLPGESLKNMMLNARIVTDPIVDKLTGWWCEYFFFYVKHTDLIGAEDIIQMHLDPTTVLDDAGVNDAIWKQKAGGYDFLNRAMESVIRWYFRDEAELTGTPYGSTIWDAGLIRNLATTMPSGVSATDHDWKPIAKVNQEGWWQSLITDAATADAEDRLPGDAPDFPDGVPDGLATAWTHWQAMVSAGATEATFEDYLRTFGVKASKAHDEEQKRPELIRFSKTFQFPTNTVDPASGTPTSAVVWSVQERADKTRYFAEPGFILGLQVVRPKVYYSSADGHIAQFMNQAFNWMPALLEDFAAGSLKKFSGDAGPVKDASEDYWIDLKDALLYGEQWVNHTGAANTVTAPLVGNSDYASGSDVISLFKNTTNSFVRTDGVVMLDIATRYSKDTSR